MNKEEKQVEASIYDSRKVIWTESNVLWTYKFSSDVPNNDK